VIENGARVVEPGTRGSQISPELLPGEVELHHESLLRGEFQQVGPRERNVAETVTWLAQA
jgi:hypothetical protein